MLWPKHRLRLRRRAKVNLHAAHVQEEGGFDSTNQTTTTFSEGELDGEASTEPAAPPEDVEFFIESLVQADDFAEIVRMMRERRHMLGTTFLRELDDCLSDARWAAFIPGEEGAAAGERVRKLLDIQAAELEIRAR